MRFSVTIEQLRYGQIECDVPDEKWERITYPYARRKLIKQAAEKAMADGAEIAWQKPVEPEATTIAMPLDEAPWNEWHDYMAAKGSIGAR